ncbi:MAG TPA: class I SAM-dependent methyltransferase [Dongiaceae bacterium]|nr:class I SAM-dependent methyltransferase [Dongiaceae bacterium]
MNESLSRKCPVCGAQQAELFLSKSGFQLMRCAGCSMIYTNPVPAEMASGDFYDRAGNEYLSAEKLESDYSDVRFERELRLFRAHCKSGSVLDVGCSSGAFLYQLKKRYPSDYQTCGTDVSGPPLDHAAKMGVPIIKGNFLTHHFDQSFDAVTFWAVMEHLFEPQLFLKKAAAILKPGGLCFILVPNMRSLAVRLLGAKYRYIYAEHLNYFTPETLAKFANLEFSVLDLKSTHLNPLVIWKDFRGGNREVPRAERSQLLKRTTAYKKSRWMFPIKCCYQAAEAVLGNFLMADNLVIIWRKK